MVSGLAGLGKLGGLGEEKGKFGARGLGEVGLVDVDILLSGLSGRIGMILLLFIVG